MDRRFDPYQEDMLAPRQFGPEPSMRPQAELDVKDQHLMWLSHVNGYLTGRNGLLEEDNNSLKRRVAEQELMIKDGKAENVRQRERIDVLSDENYKLRQEREIKVKE